MGVDGCMSAALIKQKQMKDINDLFHFVECFGVISLSKRKAQIHCLIDVCIWSLIDIYEHVTLWPTNETETLHKILQIINLHLENLTINTL